MTTPHLTSFAVSRCQTIGADGKTAGERRIEELETALVEWRDARQHIFDNQHLTSVDHKPAWDRLANAETALMAVARTVRVSPEKADAQEIRSD